MMRQSFTAGDGRPLEAELVVVRGGDLPGRVVAARNQPAVDYSVVVFAIDASRWQHGSRYLALARADREGTFRIDGLPRASTGLRPSIGLRGMRSRRSGRAAMCWDAS